MKAPFEPLLKASLKHLTLKTVFFWLWVQESAGAKFTPGLIGTSVPSRIGPRFLCAPRQVFCQRTSLHGRAQRVTPVVIPALAPTLDRSLKEDRSHCPVGALRYYLDKTQDLRSKKELVFVSFKKNFNKDISPSIIISPDESRGYIGFRSVAPPPPPPPPPP